MVNGGNSEFELATSEWSRRAYDRLRDKFAWFSVEKFAIGNNGTWVLLIAFSVLYFVQTCIRASEKTFWFDELQTLYIARLPTFQAVWAAIVHGADYNPPLFYLVHRASRALFGEGLIAMRLPQIIGFWVLCLCLFRVVYKRVGIIGAWTAMLFPLITVAYYYAYEARGPGIVLGFCGLALVCWQALEEEKRKHRKLWLTAFGVCLGAAFLTHCYAIVIAVPFGLVELVRTARSRVIDWGKWLSLIIPVIIAAIVFVPLLHNYRSFLLPNERDQFLPGLLQIHVYYKSLLSSCILVVVFALVALALQWAGFLARFGPSSIQPAAITFQEGLLAVAFLGMPLYGVVLAGVVKGSFAPRHFISGVIGLCLILGFAARTPRRNWAAAAIAVVVTCFVIGSSAKVAWDRYRGGGEWLAEPTSVLMNTVPGKPLAAYSLLLSNSSGSLPIIVNGIDFLYLVHYKPALAPRLYLVTPSQNQVFYQLLGAVRKWCHINFNREQTYDEFLPAHSEFLLYDNGSRFPLLSELMASGSRIAFLKFGDEGHFLAEVHLPNGARFSVPR